ncbi:protein YIF1B-B isoform X2 [Photinus pyralis]|uniref:Protein YIF1 n=1 Tax=Photinus pyralis TaxID=7054 RepID=A0A1Y1L7J5_PHOPY|nr:protein YIF1B-B isoform X2 [Photinus pyralis]
MNFNANTGARPTSVRKVKRVSDVNAMGYNPYPQQPPAAYQPNSTPLAPAGYSYEPTPIDYGNPQVQQQYATPTQPQFNPQNPNMVGVQFNPYVANTPSTQMGNVFAQPIVQDMAFQYSQQLANTGKDMVKQGLEQYVAVSRLKYYFAVDTKYVISKLGLLFFPFMHSDWSVKYEQGGDPIQPRFEVNAPDLYIPTMAYFTYILVTGLMLGMQQRFTPEQIVMQASSALAWCIVELVVYSCTRYIINLQIGLHTMDLLAYSGYKYVGIIAIILISLVSGHNGYYALFLYVNLALMFFLIRSLTGPILQEKQVQYYGEAPAPRNKRRLYFLLLIIISQPALSWWLSYHLLPPNTPVVANR